MHLKHDNLHFMFTCEQKAMIQYKCSVEWLFVWPDRCYFIRTVNEKSMHWHLQHNWWSCRYFSTFIDSREWKKTLRKRDDEISTSKTTWSEQRSKFAKRTKRFSSFLPCLKQHSFSFLSTPFRRHFVLAELVQMFHLHKASLNSWTNLNNKCVWLFVFFECEFFSSYLFVPMMKSSQVPKYEQDGGKTCTNKWLHFMNAFVCRIVDFILVLKFVESVMCIALTQLRIANCHLSTQSEANSTTFTTCILLY